MPPYEMRIKGETCETYDTLREALRKAREMVIVDADLDTEIIDCRTGRACMVAASKRWRDEIAAILGA